MPGPSSRLFTLLSLLQVQREWPSPELAARLDVTPRTIRRDIDQLRELGYAIEAAKGPYGGYRLTAGSALPPLLFDDDQAIAVAVALQSAPSAGVELGDAAERALNTVRQVMPSRLQQRIDTIRVAEPASSARVSPRIVEVVSAAVRDERTLRFRYGGHADATSKRVEPHAVIARDSRWYLIAWDLDKADWRFFRLDRMAPSDTRGAPFTPRPFPTGDAHSFLAARSKGSNDADVWPCYGEVLLYLPAAEIEPWLGDAELQPVDSSRSRLRIGSWSWAGLLSWVIRFDAPFEVLGPPEFVAAISGFADRLTSSTRIADET